MELTLLATGEWQGQDRTQAKLPIKPCKTIWTPYCWEPSQGLISSSLSAAKLFCVWTNGASDVLRSSG